MTTDTPQIRLGLPKGRMNAGILQLLADAGMPAVQTGRDYRPRLRNCAFDVKLLKPQNVVTMLDEGSRDLGFAGADWVGELGAELVELLDLQLDPVRIVAAAPKALLVDGRLPQRPLRIATEYAGLTREWIAREGLDARIVHSHGATEAFPPDDAELIVDNTSTGTTLQQNGLEIVAELSRSSTRLFANPRSYADDDKRAVIDAFVLLLRSVLAARSRAMLDVNVPSDRLQDAWLAQSCGAAFPVRFGQQQLQQIAETQQRRMRLIGVRQPVGKLFDERDGSLQFFHAFRTKHGLTTGFGDVQYVIDAALRFSDFSAANAETADGQSVGDFKQKAERVVCGDLHFGRTIWRRLRDHGGKIIQWRARQRQS